MTFGAQVLHIIRKDLRQSAWEFGVTSVLLVLTTFLAARWIPSGAYSATSAASLLAYALWFAGFFTCAAVLHNDPPTLVNRFWASKPIDAMALLGAKLIIVSVVMLVLPLAAQAFALTMLGVPAHTVPLFARESLRIVLPVVPALLLTGALTDDLKSFVFTWVGMGVSAILLSMVVGDQMTAMFVALGSAHTVMAVAWYAASFVAIVGCYRGRDFDRRYLSGASILLYWSLFGWYSDAVDTVNREVDYRVFSNVPDSALDVDSSRVEIQTDSSRVLRVYVGAGDTPHPRRVALSTITMSLDTGGLKGLDGFADNVEWRQSSRSPAIGRDLRIVNPDAIAIGTFAFRFSPATSAELDRTSAHVRLHAIAAEYEPESWISLDIRKGATSVGSMHAYAFDKLAPASHDVGIEFLQSTLTYPNPHSVGPDDEWFEYFLVNDSLRTATVLSVDGSWTHTQPIVLPGQSINTKPLFAVDAQPVVASNTFERGSSSITSTGVAPYRAFTEDGSRSDQQMAQLPYLRGRLLIVRWTKRSQRSITLKLTGK